MGVACLKFRFVGGCKIAKFVKFKVSRYTVSFLVNLILGGNTSHNNEHMTLWNEHFYVLQDNSSFL